ncbi:hypothetical protein [Desulfotruncus alcoholivorax]|uniref:hypothetical protein n=1 Tax=Desulfotruncus alcoholivorax TaxID=265477 RepID=UPI0012FEE82E|nr:hypothetical protein [Desulfotruncus alcoholivorax]
MIALVKYVAKRDKDHLKTISREIVSITHGDIDKEYSDLARIIFPSIMKMIEKQETGNNAASR